MGSVPIDWTDRAHISDVASMQRMLDRRYALEDLLGRVAWSVEEHLASERKACIAEGIEEEAERHQEQVKVEQDCEAEKEVARRQGYDLGKQTGIEEEAHRWQQLLSEPL